MAADSTVYLTAPMDGKVHALRDADGDGRGESKRTCNACEEANPEHATLLRADLDGRGREIFARGFEGGTPVAIEDFVTGFLVESGNAHIGRPAGVAIAGDGALLFTDDANGMIYRVVPD